ncbi:ATP-binding protein [candidate division KSB1 bacterium]|nr:ATP-binding protein [candidate division KSB1 bacterium]
MNESITEKDPCQFMLKKINENSKWYDKVVIKAVIAKQENSSFIYDARIDFPHKSDKIEEEITHDYGKIILATRILELDEFSQMIKSFSSKQIDIKDLKGIKIDGSFGNNFHHVSSKTDYINQSNDWSFWLFQYSSALRIHLDSVYEPLVTPGNHPAYPNVFEATQSLLGLNTSPNVNNPIGITFLVPDYSARIKTLEIADSHIQVNIEERELNSKDMITKFFCKKGEKQNFPSNDVAIGKDGIVTFDAPFTPDEVHVYLLEKATGNHLDSRLYGSYMTERQQGIIVKTSTEKLESFLAKGEGQDVEFKQDIDKDDEFLETIVAFANTNDGVILLGIDDEDRVVGFYDDFDKTSKRIRGIISGRCEPNINVMIEEREFDNRPIIVITVKEGKDKPYIIRNKSGYVRVDDHDIPMKRPDLDRIYRDKYQDRSTIGSI